MKNYKEKQYDMDSSVPQPSSKDLRGRQSVRATFKLSETCIDAISILSAQLGIKQKSVFDHLMEDDQVLESIAREFEHQDFERHERIQKTFVVSRRSLSFLDMIARNTDTPRDALVEYSVQRLLPLIAREREKHKTRKEVFAEMARHFKEGERLLSKVEDMLGTDDPIFDKFEAAMATYRNTLKNIAGFIERGKIIEEFQTAGMSDPLSSSKG